MSRLASLQGPSSPSPRPVKPQAGKSSPAKSPRHSRRDPGPSIYDIDEPNTTPPSESTYHRKLRTLLLELKEITKTWTDLVLLDGLKAAKGLVDARTELDNSLAALPSDRQPHIRLVNPKLAVMEAKISDLQGVVAKLDKQFHKMGALVDSADALLYEACRTKGWNWVNEDPLWCTWPLERFVSRLPALLPPYHRALNDCVSIATELRSHDSSFEASRDLLRQWIAQPCLSEGIWDELEQIFEVEVDRWTESKTSK